jgi:hypothetical protein
MTMNKTGSLVAKLIIDMKPKNYEVNLEYCDCFLLIMQQKK